MVEMNEFRMPIDLITLHQHLKNTRQIESVGGFEYLASLHEKVPSAANLGYYLVIVWEKYLLRRQIQLCTKAADQAAIANEPVQDMLNSFASEAELLAQKCALDASHDADPKQAAHKVLDYAEERFAHKGIPGLSSPWPDLDRITMGFQPGWAYIIGARPSQGKTALINNIVQHLSVECSPRVPTLVFSLEMTQERFVQRVCCGLSRINSKHVSGGTMDQGELSSFLVSAGKCSSSPMYVIDKSDLTVPQMRAIARFYVRNKGVKLVGIDYLQRIRASRNQEKRTYEVGEVSTALQAMAKELNVPVITLAQLKREYQEDSQYQEGQRKRPRLPNMADLGDSGITERDADVIILLARRPEQVLSDPIWQYKWVVDKNRDGELGIVDMVFFNRFTKFEEATKTP
jgi:replicative DNA helicase